MISYNLIDVRLGYILNSNIADFVKPRTASKE